MTTVNLQRVVKVLRVNMKSSTGLFCRRQSTKSIEDTGSNIPRYASYAAQVSIVVTPLVCFGYYRYNLNKKEEKRRQTGIELRKYKTYALVGNEKAAQQVSDQLRRELGAPKWFFTDIRLITNAEQFEKLKEVDNDVHLSFCDSVDGDLIEPSVLPSNLEDVPSNIKEKSIMIAVKSHNQTKKIKKRIQALKEINAVKNVFEKTSVVSVLITENKRDHNTTIPVVFFVLALYLGFYGLGYIGWHLKTVKKTLTK